MSYTVIIDDKQLQAAAQTLKIKAEKGFVPAVTRLLRTRLAEGERAIKYTLTGSVLRRRTGNLVRSVAFTIDQQGQEKVVGRVGIIRQGPAMVYAGVHITGAIIRPKRGQYLAVPLAAAQTAAGVPRFTPRQVPGAFFIRSKRGNLLLVRRVAGGLQPLFVMKRQVRIPRRDYFTGPKEMVLRNITEDAANLLRDELRLI